MYCGAQPYSAASPSAAIGKVPVNGAQSPISKLHQPCPIRRRTTGEFSVGEKRSVSDRTKLEVAAGSAVSNTAEQCARASNYSQNKGSWTQFPTAQRHASGRYGAAMELVQQYPKTTGVELAGSGGSYVTTCVACGPVGALLTGGLVFNGVHARKTVRYQKGEREGKRG